MHPPLHAARPRATAAWATVAVAGAAAAALGCGGPEGRGAEAPPAAARRRAPAPAPRPRPTGIDREAAAQLTGAGFDPSYQVLADDARWFDDMAEVPVGAGVPARQGGGGGGDPPQGAPAEMWRDMGFLPGGGDTFVRAADLLGELPALVPTEVPELAHIDCIAILPTSRHGGGPQALYASLASLFAAFPAGVQVNVLEQGGQPGALSPGRLAGVLGQDLAQQVHVHPVTAQAAAYLRGELSASRRDGWNYARALRSYRGHRGLVVVEGPVQWSRGGPARFDARLQKQVLPTASLFNDRCEGLCQAHDPERAELFIDRLWGHEHYLVSLRAMYYHPAIANSLGRYVQLRMHRQDHGDVVGWFLAEHRVAVGFAFPSIAQHIGGPRAAHPPRQAWSFDASPCFRESF